MRCLIYPCFNHLFMNIVYLPEFRLPICSTHMLSNARQTKSKWHTFIAYSTEVVFGICAHACLYHCLSSKGTCSRVKIMIMLTITECCKNSDLIIYQVDSIMNNQAINSRNRLKKQKNTNGKIVGIMQRNTTSSQQIPYCFQKVIQWTPFPIHFSPNCCLETLDPFSGTPDLNSAAYIYQFPSMHYLIPLDQQFVPSYHLIWVLWGFWYQNCKVLSLPAR